MRGFVKVLYKGVEIEMGKVYWKLYVCGGVELSKP